MARRTEACVLLGLAACAPHNAHAQTAGAGCEESGGRWVWPLILVIVLVAVGIGGGMKRLYSKQLSAMRRQQLQELAETKATEAIDVAKREIEDDMESAHLSMAELVRISNHFAACSATFFTRKNCTLGDFWLTRAVIWL